MWKERTDSCKLSFVFLTRALAPTLLQKTNAKVISEQTWSHWVTAILKGIHVVVGAVSGFFSQTEALELLGLSVSENSFLQSGLSCKGETLTFKAAWCSLKLPGYKETLSMQPFYAQRAPGCGEGSCSYHSLSSAPLQLLTSPERTGGFCFRQFCVAGAYPPLPIFTWERDATHGHWVLWLVFTLRFPDC